MASGDKEKGCIFSESFQDTCLVNVNYCTVTINKICKKIRLKTKFQVLLGQRPCPGFRNGSGFES